MPYFKLKGKPILPNNAECPVEIVSQSTNCSSNSFFKTSENDEIGIVLLSGVSDAGYKLISADANTSLDILKNQDAFEGKIKINNVIQKYCFKGRAPTNSILVNRSSYGGGTKLYMFRRADGYCELQNSSRGYISTLSSVEENKKIYTFVLCGSGAGGHSGTSGFGFHGGGGGGGGGGCICTIYFTDLCKTNNQNFLFELYVASGGGNNSGGSTSYVKVIEGPSESINTISEAYGGYTGGESNGGSGGGHQCNIPTSGQYMYRIGYHGQNGQAGGSHNNYSSNLGTSASYNYSVNNSYIQSTGGTTGAGYGDLATKPGGGGPSPFGNGNSGEYGGGGRGGTGNMFGGKDGLTGARGFVEIRY